MADLARYPSFSPSRVPLLDYGRAWDDVLADDFGLGTPAGVSGAHAGTLGAPTQAGVGGVAVSGAHAGTLPAPTHASAGDVSDPVGEAAQAGGGFVQAGGGGVAVSGGAAQSPSASTPSAAGGVAVSGGAAQAGGGAAHAGAGGIAIAGVHAGTVGATMTGDGTVTSGSSGEAAQVAGGSAMNATGAVAVSGGAAQVAGASTATRVGDVYSPEAELARARTIALVTRTALVYCDVAGEVTVARVAKHRRLTRHAARRYLDALVVDGVLRRTTRGYAFR